MISIMLIEDDEVDVMAVQRMFKKNRVINPIYIAENGLDALDLLHRKNKNNFFSQEKLLILLDLFMPKMNGLDFLIELRLNLKMEKIPVIILASYDEIKTEIKTDALNIAGYFSKPIIFSELTKIVKFDVAESSQIRSPIPALIS